MCLVASTVKPCSGIGKLIRELDNAMTGELLPAAAKCEGLRHSVNRWNRASLKKFSVKRLATIRNNQKKEVEGLILPPLARQQPAANDQ
jgi:hypothetical protein